MAKQDALTNSEIQAVKDIILKTVDCEKIYLFGSFAYGTPQKNSDYDFYVVLKDENQNPVFAEQNIYRSLSKREGRNTPVDVLAENRNKFNDLCVLPTIERKIAREGVLLYDSARIA
jgi:predicted nucleotidyltransferase